jgi:rubrerythrin
MAMQCQECEECYMTAVSVEITARMYYLRMVHLFAHEPKVANIFREMADEEAGHAHALQGILDAGVHSPEVHKHAKEYMRSLLFLVTSAGDQLAREPMDLQEVFEFAVKLEGAEVNDVYLHLTNVMVAQSGAEGHFAAKSINEHLHHLRVLGELYSLEKRKNVLPLYK